MVIFRGSLFCGGWYWYRLWSFLLLLRYDVSKTLDAYQIDSALKLRKVSNGCSVGGRNFMRWGAVWRCVCVFFLLFWHVFFLMGNIVIVGQEGKGDVYIFWVGIGEIRGVSLQCNGVYPFFVRRSFRSSQIVICKNSSLSCFFHENIWAQSSDLCHDFFLFKKPSGGSSHWYPKKGSFS